MSINLPWRAESWEPVLRPGSLLHRVVDAANGELCQCDSRDQAEEICRAVNSTPQAEAFAVREAQLLSSIEYLRNNVETVRRHFQGEVELHQKSAASLRGALQAICPLGSNCKCQIFAAEPAGKGCALSQFQRGAA